MTQWDVLPGEEPRRLAVEEPRHAPPGRMETRDAGDARPRFHSAPPTAAAGYQAPRGHGPGPRANEQGTQTPGRTVLRIQGVDPGMSPLECLARVWHYRGLRAVNPPQPAEGADDPPSVFLLFETAADARAAERAVGEDPPYPRPGGGALDTRRSVRRSGSKFGCWTSDGTPEQALDSGGRTLGPRGESREGQRRRPGSPTASPRAGEPPARRRREEGWPSEPNPGGVRAEVPPERSPPPAGPPPGRNHPDGSPPRMIDGDLLMELLAVYQRGFLQGARVPSPQEEPLRPFARAGAAGPGVADRGPGAGGRCSGPGVGSTCSSRKSGVGPLRSDAVGRSSPPPVPVRGAFLSSQVDR